VSARNWPPLRRRPPARHRDRLDLAQAPANLAASLPLPPPIVEPRPAPVPPPRREPVTEVVCGFCGVTGLSSAIPDIGQGRRCADTDACARRWGNREAAARFAPVAEVPAEAASAEAHPYPVPAPVAEPGPEPAADGTPEAVTQAAINALAVLGEKREAAEEPEDATKVIEPAKAETEAMPAVPAEDAGEQS
jgi:hypothetical protein